MTDPNSKDPFAPFEQLPPSGPTTGPAGLRAILMVVGAIVVLILGALVFLIQGKPAPTFPPLQQNSTQSP